MIKYVVCFALAILVLNSSAKELNERSIYQMTLAELFDIQVVSAASGVEQKVSSAPATVTIINKEQWQATGANSLAEVLSTVAGVHVGQPKFYSYYHTSITIRGLSGFGSDKVKILIDGMSFEYMQNSSIPWGFHIPLTGFSRIEVIKSSGSAVYGADAYAGIINLVSEPHESLSDSDNDVNYDVDTAVKVGSFDTVEVNTNLNVQYKQLQWMFAFDYSHSNDDPGKIIAADLQTTLDELFGSNASLAPGRMDQSYNVFKIISKWKIQDWSLDYFSWKNRDLGIGVGPAQIITEDGELNFDFERFNSNYRIDNWGGGQLDLQYSHMRQELDATIDVFPNGAILPIGSDGNVSLADSVGLSHFVDGLIGQLKVRGNSDTLNLTYQRKTNDNDYQRLQIGYEKHRFYVNERKNFGPSILDGTQNVVSGILTDVSNTPYVFIPNVSRDFWYVSYHQQWQFNELINLSAGVRHDHYSDFGSTTNPRLALILHATDKLNLKLFAGSAFKAPSFAQLYAQNNPSTLGNPNLKEERIGTLDLGSTLEYMLHDDLLINLSLYRYRASGLIEFESNSSISGRMAQNTGKQVGYGGELQVKWKPMDNFTVDSHYSYTQAKDDNGYSIEGLPSSMAYIGANWRYSEQLNISFSTRWIGSRTREANDPRQQLGSYSLSNIAIQYDNFAFGFDGNVTINNLFDRQAKEPSYGAIATDYPIKGFNVLFGLSKRF